MRDGNQRKVPSLAMITFVALFVTCLITAQLIASKILLVDVSQWTLTIPAGTLAYAGTFFATDCMNELYGEEYARRVVNVGFIMNFVMMALVWSAIAWPAAPHSIDAEIFEKVLGSGTNIVAGSLMAYIISQNIDVYLFSRIRDKTSGNHLWLRNIGSTGLSQLIDTTIFTAVAFGLAPIVFDIGFKMGIETIAFVIFSQFMLKLFIALVDTPLIYLTTSYLK